MEELLGRMLKPKPIGSLRKEMAKKARGEGFLGFYSDSEYPKYFGYHPKFRGISEVGADINKLGDILEVDYVIS